MKGKWQGRPLHKGAFSSWESGKGNRRAMEPPHKSGLEKLRDRELSMLIARGNSALEGTSQKKWLGEALR